MMADAMDLFEALTGTDITGICIDVVEKNESVIADINATQLSGGERSDGKKIGKYKNILYSDFKHEMNPKPGFGNVDLRLTGFFYRGLYAQVIGQEIEYGSKDEKADKLQKKYGDRIFGLNNDSREEISESFLRPQFKNEVEAATGLKFN